MHAFPFTAAQPQAYYCRKGFHKLRVLAAIHHCGRINCTLWIRTHSSMHVVIMCCIILTMLVYVLGITAAHTVPSHFSPSSTVSTSPRQVTIIEPAWQSLRLNLAETHGTAQNKILTFSRSRGHILWSVLYLCHLSASGMWSLQDEDECVLSRVNLNVYI